MKGIRGSTVVYTNFQLEKIFKIIKLRIFNSFEKESSLKNKREFLKEIFLLDEIKSLLFQSGSAFSILCRSSGGNFFLNSIQTILTKIGDIRKKVFSQ